MNTCRGKVAIAARTRSSPNLAIAQLLVDHALRRWPDRVPAVHGLRDLQYACRLRSASAAEPDVVVSVVGREGVAVGGARQPEHRAAGASADDTALAMSRPARVRRRRVRVVARVVPVGDPLPDVAGEIVQRLAGVVRPDVDGVPGIAGAAPFALVVAEVRARAVGRVAPRIDATVGAAGGALPLGLGRQALVRPSTIGVRRRSTTRRSPAASRSRRRAGRPPPACRRRRRRRRRTRRG